MHAFDVLGDPVRRRILELLGDGELTSGALCEVIQRQFGISQPAVSQHLATLRKARLVAERREGRLVYLNVDRIFDPLRSEPRFRTLIARLKIPARPL